MKALTEYDKGLFEMIKELHYLLELKNKKDNHLYIKMIVY